MFFELFLGLRYLKAKRKQALISLITLISMLGVMIGVMALVVVLSVMNGFKSDLTSKIMGVHAHLLVLNHKGAFKNYEKVAGIVDKVNGVIASTPFIYNPAMVNNSGQILSRKLFKWN
ncbi:ABC transporter permease [Thermodesulfobacteriota bacterium]